MRYKDPVVFGLMALLLVMTAGLSSAADFDNSKTYEPISKVITITNFFGLGETLETLKLVKNTDICGSECSAEKEITIYNKGKLIDQVKFDTINEDGTREEEAINDYQFYIRGKEIQVPYKTCADSGLKEKNGSMIYNCKAIAYRTEYDWTLYDFEEVDAGSYYVKLVGYKESTKTVDWIVTAQGKELTEWTTWAGENLTVGLISYYTFNNTFADIVNASSPLINQGTINASGILGDAKNMSTNKFMNRTRGSIPVNSSAITQCMWVMPGTTANHAYTWMGVSSPAHPASDGSMFGLITDATNFVVIGYWADVTGTTTFTKDTWYFVCVQQENINSRRLWVNGLNEANGTAVYNITASDFYVGQSPQNPQNNFGKIDELGIWNRSLSYGEINALYNDGLALGYPFDTVSISLLSVTLTSPANGTTITDTGDNFIANYSVTNLNMTNATYYVWYSSGVLLNSTTIAVTGNSTNSSTLFIDNLTIGNYLWNVKLCGTNATATTCEYATDNYTLGVGANVFGNVYNEQVYETAREYFSANITLVPGLSLYSAKINYNGTDYPATFVAINSSNYTFSVDIDIPNVSAAGNISFKWKLIYSIGSGSFISENTSAYNQTINVISLLKCGGTNYTANFSAWNEKNITGLDTWNFLGTFDYWLGQGTRRKTVSVNDLNINTTQMCISPNSSTYYSDAILQYEKSGYTKRNYYLFNNSLTSTMQDFKLFLLQSASSNSFIVTVRDQNQLPVTSAYIYVQRYYPGTGQYQTVAMGMTDASGNTVVGVESETEDYRLLILLNGAVIYTSPVQKIYCAVTPCTIPIQINRASITPWEHIGNLSNLIYNLEYNETSKIVSYTYVDTSGTTHYGRFHVYTVNSANGKQTICNSTSLSIAATLTCNLTGQDGTIYADGYISRSPEKLVWSTSFVLSGLKSIMGVEGFFWAMIIILILAFAGILMGGVPGGVIGVISGIIGITWLGIASFGTVTLWGVIALGLFIIWVVRQ